MYLSLYFNEKYVGQVDIEVYMQDTSNKLLVHHNQDSSDLIDSLQLMYGKKLTHLSPEQLYDRSMVGQTHRVYLTKRAGPTLQWDTRVHRLCI